MLKDRYKPMNHTTLLRIPAPRRWTAASVGANRYRAAIGALPIQIILSFVKIILPMLLVYSCRLVIKYAI